MYLGGTTPQPVNITTAQNSTQARSKSLTFRFYQYLQQKKTENTVQRQRSTKHVYESASNALIKHMHARYCLYYHDSLISSTTEAHPTSVVTLFYFEKNKQTPV
jgi:hypothetical protein